MKLFISRPLSPDSPIRKIVSEKGMELIDQSLIDIKFRSFDRLPYADWYFFYSKNGVRSYQKYLANSENQKAKDIKLAAIGPGTGKFMFQNQLPCEFIGDGGTDQTASDFLEISKKDDSILFFRARHSANRLMKAIKPHREVLSIVAYENEMLQKKFPSVDIAILTSSRNARAFLQNNALPRKKIVAIGQPTYNTLISLSVPSQNIVVAKEPSEEGIVKAVEEELDL